MERIGVIIVAGGSGCRMGTARPKQFLLLGGRPVLAHAIDRFAQALPGAPIVVVLPEEHIAFWRNLTARFDVARHTVTPGGAQRFHSVSRGLAALPPGMEFVAVHDGVRPLVPLTLIRRTVDAARIHGAAIPAIEPVDSFRITGDDGSHPIDRRRLRAVQTPQIFRAGLLRNAYETTYRPEFTDDASVVEHSGAAVFLCEGERRNLKITTPEDLLYAEALLAEELSDREEVPEEGNASPSTPYGNHPAATPSDPHGSRACNAPEAFSTGNPFSRSGAYPETHDKPAPGATQPGSIGHGGGTATPLPGPDSPYGPDKRKASVSGTPAPGCGYCPCRQAAQGAGTSTTQPGRTGHDGGAATPQPGPDTLCGPREKERVATTSASCSGPCSGPQPGGMFCPSADRSGEAESGLRHGCPQRLQPDTDGCCGARRPDPMHRATGLSAQATPADTEAPGDDTASESRPDKR